MEVKLKEVKDLTPQEEEVKWRSLGEQEEEDSMAQWEVGPQAGEDHHHHLWKIMMTKVHVWDIFA